MNNTLQIIFQDAPEKIAQNHSNGNNKTTHKILANSYDAFGEINV